ncbi:hypothetical protein [Micrococcus sp.]|uniref:hypothetical protein n=1 Tax=Micrococcus sp. TaxID=1271 RepID=UPI0026DD4905|nr:hypothetical protein [Micrococcus sp.]MDO4240479.1 hypothetical protein [Micrococcus sp.]
MSELDGWLASLRGVLTTERSRIRPDTFALLWSVLEHTEGLLPSWDRCASLRAADALQLVDVLTRRLLAGLQDFLVLPDADKPAHADLFHQDVQSWADRIVRHRRRLLRVITSRQEAWREIDGPEHR